MVNHKGWDCKDDLSHLKYDDFKVKLIIVSSLNGLFNDLQEIDSSLQSHETIDSNFSVQSSVSSFEGNPGKIFRLQEKNHFAFVNF